MPILTNARKREKAHKYHEKQVVINAYKTQMIYLCERGWVPYFNVTDTALLWRNKDHDELFTSEAFRLQICMEKNIMELVHKAVRESKILIREPRLYVNANEAGTETVKEV